MTGRGRAVIGDLALDPHVGILPLDVVAYFAHQLAHSPHPPQAGGRSFRSNLGKNQSKLAP
jgi:hypothetical protein